MANFQTIFRDCGLQGIIPYAFDQDNPAYRFLCEKLSIGISLFVISEPETGLPYYFIDSQHVFFNVYSTREAATVKCRELAMNKRDTTPALIETSGWAAALWRRYRDLGATHIRLDDSVWVSLGDIVPMATYEGILSVNTPLRNPTLNSIMYCHRQDVEAECCTDALSALFWQTFKASKFYVLLRPIHAHSQGTISAKYNFVPHFLTLPDGRKAFLLFTDNEFKLIYGRCKNLSPNAYKIVALFNFDDIHHLVVQLGYCALVNAFCGDFILAPDTINEFESILLNQSALNNRNTACSDVAPMVDFFQHGIT